MLTFGDFVSTASPRPTVQVVSKTAPRMRAAALAKYWIFLFFILSFP
jgi:hypothetical protein